MNYSEAMEYMRAVSKRGVVPGLENMRALCRAVGNPERGLNAVHIAGTNGKGSVGAFVGSVLQTAGYDVCRYSSPAVFEYEDILQHNGSNMTRRDAVRFIEIVKAAADKLENTGEAAPTAFELETAAAFLYCREKKCDYALIEVGMGGRLDATNVIEKPVICAVTPISLDHTAFLGDTTEKIAYEKCGIIKYGCTVVSAPQSGEAAAVIKRVCRERNARLIKAKNPENIRGRVFDYDGMRDVEISLAGAFQPVNAAAAIEICRALNVSEDEIRRGLRTAVWHGRFETISEDPLVIIDGAHNKAAAKMLEETIKRDLSERRLNFIIGVLSDKEVEEIAARTAYLADKIYAVEPNNPRALKKELLAEILRRYNPASEAIRLDEAVKKCMSDSGAATIVFGSLSYLKDAAKAVRNEQSRQNLKK